jgi:small subunit ribosomal protein S8
MDQIANMINTIKNASLKGHELVVISHSNIKYSIAECLVKEGYLKNITKKIRKSFPVIELELSYEEDGEPKVKEAKRISKSSCRVYKGVKDLKNTKGYRGITVLSTPKGVMTDREAKKEMVGGEVLFKLS